MSQEDCIFCKIIGGKIPAIKIYEDEDVLAFLDIGPISDGHTLVVPKQHCEDADKCPAEIMVKVALRLGKIAKAVKEAVACDGYNILGNNGRAAGQLVEHLHFHIIPRKIGDGVFNRWPSYKYPQGKAEKIAEKIKSNL
jgi:histidine triad (HIT) family protein